MKTATFIVDLEAPGASQHVFRLDPPIDAWDGVTYEHVIVSAVVVPFTGPETYIFGAKKDGDDWEVADWAELDGSVRGSLDHALALRGAGYEVAS